MQRHFINTFISIKISTHEIKCRYQNILFQLLFCLQEGGTKKKTKRNSTLYIYIYFYLDIFFILLHVYNWVNLSFIIYQTPAAVFVEMGNLEGPLFYFFYYYFFFIGKEGWDDVRWYYYFFVCLFPLYFSPPPPNASGTRSEYLG